MNCTLRAVFIFFLASVACIAADSPNESTASNRAIADLENWLREPREKGASIFDTSFSKVPLVKTDAERASALFWSDRAAFIRETRAAEMGAKEIQIGALKMKFEAVEFGAKDKLPADGRSLFLSLHGGGGAPTALNDSQWRNQIQLAKSYAPAEGIYLAPRAPTDNWNLWHEPHIDEFFDRIIEDFIVLENVNPNRAYVLGYSAGGDGVYQLAPRMADRWAAAAMMAGHPNDASPLGLRNIGFAIQVGANDGAYHRNEIAADWGRKLDELAKDDPGGYAHFTELHAGKSHWMDLEDRKAIPWMEKFTRQPFPEKIVWHQSSVLHSRFYWLALAKEKARAGQDIVAERKGQTITVTASDPVQIRILLNDTMLNLDEPVSVAINGAQKFSGTVSRTIASIARSIEERGDPLSIFTAEIAIATDAKSL